MSFVKDLGVDRNGEAIVQTIIQMGKTLGMDVIAEGVETEHHAAFLRKYPTMLQQGYYYGKPQHSDVWVKQCLNAAAI